MVMAADFEVEQLGIAKVRSPLKNIPFVRDEERTLLTPTLNTFLEYKDRETLPVSMEIAGPRKFIYFDPQKTKAGIVTCGGLCPGINAVIRSIVMTAWYGYGVRSIMGFRYGFQGLTRKYHHPPLELTPERVANIHELGGTILGSSRGHQDIGEMTDTLETMGIDILFCIGGDGTMRGATRIAEEVKKRGLKISIIGLPKTIDNDIMYIERSFGFETAFTIAASTISAAHTEAIGAPNGVGLVKLMGRHSGYIAASAALALPHVNFVLIPEVPFELEGPKGLLAALEERLKRRRHAVIVVAEGAGQDLIIKDSSKVERDISGNIKLADIGIFLRDFIKKHFKKIGMELNLRYIDPSYIIRSVPANAHDSIYCNVLGQNAVHAAMAGKTNMLVGRWNNIYTHVPIPVAISERKVIDPKGTLWGQVLEATGQPPLVND